MDVDIKLPRPHAGQLQVINSTARFKVLLCGRRWGKSLTAQIITLLRMFESKKVAYVTPTFDLGKTFFTELLKKIPPQVIRTDNRTELFIELLTGGSIKFYSGESLSRFRGNAYHIVIIDEAAFIPDLKNEWDAAIRGTLADHEGEALFISTPNGKEYFYSLYMKGNDPLEPEYESFHFPSNTNPYFPPEEFESIKRSLPSFQFNQEYLAIAGESKSNPFGIDCINQNIITTLSTNPTVVYGIDVAKTHDYSVIIGLDMDGSMTYFDRFQKPWIMTMERIKNLPQDVMKVIDSTGVGDVLYEQLQRTCTNIKGFKFTGESKPNIMYQLIKDVEAGRVKYNQVTADEMSVFEYKYSSTGHIKFEAASGYNDDCIAALAMANHHKNKAIAAKDWELYFI